MGTVETEAFLVALGVTVREVDDLGGACATWHEETATVEVCRRLCPRRRERVMRDALSRIEVESE